jgi:hypothetical protein
VKLSNLPEEIYRERLNQIDKDEKEETKFLKIDTIEKLCLNKIRFFDTFDVFLRLNYGDAVFKPENFKDLQDMERLYREKQLWVLEKLLDFSFFQKPDFVPPELEHQRQAIEPFQRMGSDMREGEAMRKAIDYDPDKEGVKTQINDLEYYGREKKLVTVKLTKYLSAQTDFSQNEKKNIAAIASLPADKQFRLNEAEVSKILTSRNHKNYYNEDELTIKSAEIRDELIKINARIDAGLPDAKKLNPKEVQTLIDAYLFATNSVHHVPNFEKKVYYISPADVAYVVTKLK